MYADRADSGIEASSRLSSLENCDKSTFGSHDSKLNESGCGSMTTPQSSPLTDHKHLNNHAGGTFSLECCELTAAASISNAQKCSGYYKVIIDGWTSSKAPQDESFDLCSFNVHS